MSFSVVEGSCRFMAGSPPKPSSPGRLLLRVVSRPPCLRHDDLDDDGQLARDSVTGTRLIGPFNAFVHAPDIGGT